MSTEAKDPSDATPSCRPNPDGQDVPLEYKRTEVGLIPEEWTSERLGNLFTFKNGLNKAKRFFGVGTPIVNYMDVFAYPGLRNTNIQGRVSLTADEIENFQVRRGDVFFTRTSETLDEIGMTSVMLDDPRNTVFSGFVLRARPIDGRLDDAYKQYCFSGNAVRQQIVSAGTYTTRALTNGRSLSAVYIALPPLPEQRAIAVALGDVDALLDGLDRLIAKKRDLKEAAMHQLLTGRTRLPGFDGEWEVKRLGDMLTICHGKNQSDVNVPDGPYPILASGGQIGLASRPLYDKPSVLIGRKGTINQPQYMATPFWTVDTLFYSEMKNGNCAKFFYYRFCLIHWMQFNEASGVPSLNARTIENIEIACPERTEQAAVATVLSDMDSEIAALEARRDKTRDLKQAMMQELLTGRTRLVQPEAAHA